MIFNLLFTRNFATLQTLNVNLTQVCTIVIVAIGMTLVIATGGIDLSVGSLMAISGALAPMIFLGKIVAIGNIYLAVAVAMVVSILAERLARNLQWLARGALPDPADRRYASAVHRRPGHRAGDDERQPADLPGTGVPVDRPRAPVSVSRRRSSSWQSSSSWRHG